MHPLQGVMVLLRSFQSRYISTIGEMPNQNCSLLYNMESFNALTRTSVSPINITYDFHDETNRIVGFCINNVCYQGEHAVIWPFQIVLVNIQVNE